MNAISAGVAMMMSGGAALLLENIAGGASLGRYANPLLWPVGLAMPPLARQKWRCGPRPYRLCR